MADLASAARKAAIEAGTYIRRRFVDGFEGQVVEKSENDFVTQYDIGSEEIIRRILSAAAPEIGFLAEETASKVREPIFWIVDPLDGTTNFIHGYPQVAVSIALWEQGRVRLACAYDPLREELFEASYGCGARLNDRPIGVSNARELSLCLLGTGFPFGVRKYAELYLRTFRDLFEKSRDIRRAGAAVLDLCHVACGRLDGFWELYLKPWDMAAGALIVREAGGAVSDFFGGEDFLESGNIVAAPIRIHREIVAVTSAHFDRDSLAELATHFIDI